MASGKSMVGFAVGWFDTVVSKVVKIGILRRIVGGKWDRKS